MSKAMGEMFEVNEKFMKLAPKIMFILQYGDQDTYMSLWHKIEELCIMTHEDRPGIREKSPDKPGDMIPIRIPLNEGKSDEEGPLQSDIKMNIGKNPEIAIAFEELCLEMITLREQA